MPFQLPRHSFKLTTLALTTITTLPILTSRFLTTNINTATMPKKIFTTTTSSNPNAPSLPTPIPSTFTDNLPLPSILVFDLDYTLWPFWVDTHPVPPFKPASSKASPGSSSNGTTYNSTMLDRHNSAYTFYPQVPTILAAARAKGITMSVASRTHTPDLAQDMLRGIEIPPLPAQEDGKAEEKKMEKTEKGQTNGHDDTDAATGNETAEKEEQTLLKSSDTTLPLKAINFFTAPQMYPGSKVRHFLEIQKATRPGGKKGSSRKGTTASGPGSSTRHDGEEVAFADMLFFDDESRNKDVERELGVTFVLVRDGVTAEEVDRGVREWRRRRGVAG